MKKKRISLVVTCYNEADNISEMYSRVRAVFRKLPSFEYELVFVDNASTDNSERLYTKLAKQDQRVKALIMSRNFGSPQPSFLAGMEYATGDAVVLLHGDIQDPPELIPEFIEQWKKGFDVVYGVRASRKGYGALWNFYYKAFYYLLQKLAYITIPLNAGEFSLLSRRVVKELLAIDEYEYYVRCLRAFVGFPQKGIEYVWDSRHHGKTTENIISGLYWAKTIIINFSFKPLAVISTLGIVATMLSMLLLVVNVLMVLLSSTRAPGVPTVIVIQLFLGGVQLLSISVIAEYLSKIFLEVKHRPRYIIKSFLNIRRPRK